MQKIRTIAVCLVCATLAGPANAQPNTNQDFPSSLPSDDEIRQILVDRVDVQHKSVGMVVGIITPHGRRVLTYGHLNQGDPRPLDGDTVFEIGSVTKVFTALLLADMVQRGAIQLDDPVAKYLPVSPRPDANGKTITLVDLATQTSGLPFFPSDVSLDNLPKAVDVVAGYTPERVYQFLSSWQPTRPIWDFYGNSMPGVLEGPRYEYMVAVAISPDGKRAVSSSFDGTLRVWDLDGNVPPRVLEGHAKAVRAVAISADGESAPSQARMTGRCVSGTSMPTRPRVPLMATPKRFARWPSVPLGRAPSPDRMTEP